jgi:hypothetical protein
MNDSMIFINTGKDIVLVDYTAWGKVAVSDREMLIKLFTYINQQQMGVKYTVLDIEFLLSIFYKFTGRYMFRKATASK